MLRNLGRSPPIPRHVVESYDPLLCRIGDHGAASYIPTGQLHELQQVTHRAAAQQKYRSVLSCFESVTDRLATVMIALICYFMLLYSTYDTRHSHAGQGCHAMQAQSDVAARHGCMVDGLQSPQILPLPCNRSFASKRTAEHCTEQSPFIRKDSMRCTTIHQLFIFNHVECCSSWKVAH